MVRQPEVQVLDQRSTSQLTNRLVHPVADRGAHPRSRRACRCVPARQRRFVRACRRHRNAAVVRANSAAVASCGDLRMRRSGIELNARPPDVEARGGHASQQRSECWAVDPTRPCAARGCDNLASGTLSSHYRPSHRSRAGSTFGAAQDRGRCRPFASPHAACARSQSDRRRRSRRPIHAMRPHLPCRQRQRYRYHRGGSLWQRHKPASPASRRTPAPLRDLRHRWQATVGAHSPCPPLSGSIMPLIGRRECE